MCVYRQQALFHVLAAYSMYNTEVGYCQGMSEIAALLLMYMNEEVSRLVTVCPPPTRRETGEVWGLGWAFWCFALYLDVCHKVIFAFLLLDHCKVSS